MPTNDDTTIRAATRADAPAVAACTRAAYAKYVPRLGREPKPMTADDARIIADGDVWLAVGADGCRGVLVLEPQADHLLIYSVAIAPSYQGRGLGRRLMALAEAQCRRHGLPAVILYTNAKMTENISYYAHLGYRETARRAHQEHRDAILVFMRKDIVAESQSGKGTEC
jgi:ribosomal protein S18 acetylase RimI-like enzyme